MKIAVARLLAELRNAGLTYRQRGHVRHDYAVLVPVDEPATNWITLEVRDGHLWASARCHSARIDRQEQFVAFAAFVAGKRQIDQIGVQQWECRSLRPY